MSRCPYASAPCLPLVAMHFDRRILLFGNLFGQFFWKLHRQSHGVPSGMSSRGHPDLIYQK